MKGIIKRIPAYSAVEPIKIKLFVSGRLLNKSWSARPVKSIPKFNKNRPNNNPPPDKNPISKSFFKYFMEKPNILIFNLYNANKIITEK